MAAPGAVQVRGYDNLVRTLRRAGADMTDLKAANREVGGIVASRTTPPRRTGRLAGTVRASGTQRAAVVRAGRASVPYAGPIHWGWPARGIRARPFLTEAAQRSEPTWVAVFEKAIDQAIAQVKGI